MTVFLNSSPIKISSIIDTYNYHISKDKINYTLIQKQQIFTFEQALQKIKEK
jgi:hypothetical protein